MPLVIMLQGSNKERGTMTETSLDEIESLRLELIADLGDDETEEELKVRYAPGTFGCHEALHVASVVGPLVERELLEHGAILANPEWFALANRACEALAELYQ